jgi:hypothetical protein
MYLATVSLVVRQHAQWFQERPTIQRLTTLVFDDGLRLSPIVELDFEPELDGVVEIQ